MECHEGSREWTGERWETEEPRGRDEFQEPELAASSLYELDRMTWLLTELYFHGKTADLPMDSWISEKSTRAREAAERLRQLHETVVSPLREAAPTGEWDPDQQPWARRALDNGETVPCYFCGEIAIIQSYSDNQADNGRLEVYCNSPQCDARETTVLVMRGGGAHLRADVKALNSAEPPANR